MFIKFLTSLGLQCWGKCWSFMFYSPKNDVFKIGQSVTALRGDSKDFNNYYSIGPESEQMPTGNSWLSRCILPSSSGEWSVSMNWEGDTRAHKGAQKVVLYLPFPSTEFSGPSLSS